MPTITTTDNTDIYVKDWGTGQPVALVQAGYRTIAYDRRGFGRSSQPWSGYDYDTLADDLAVVIDQCDARDAVLVGFSMGGGEVARYMSRHNGKSVAKAALISSVVPFMLKTADNPNGTQQTVFDGIAKAIKEDRAAFFAGFFKDFFGVSQQPNAVSDQVLSWACSVSMQASLQATLACAQSFASTDFRNDLPAFKCPTLIVHGTHDKTVPIDAAGRAAAAGIEQSTLIEYQGAPHGLFATHKQRLAKDLIDFLKN
jgi:non-heme chloroperoxidase